MAFQRMALSVGVLWTSVVISSLLISEGVAEVTSALSSSEHEPSTAEETVLPVSSAEETSAEIRGEAYGEEQAAVAKEDKESEADKWRLGRHHHGKATVASAEELEAVAKVGDEASATGKLKHGQLPGDKLESRRIRLRRGWLWGIKELRERHGKALKGESRAEGNERQASDRVKEGQEVSQPDVNQEVLDNDLSEPGKQEEEGEGEKGYLLEAATEGRRKGGFHLRHRRHGGHHHGNHKRQHSAQGEQKKTEENQEGSTEAAEEWEDSEAHPGRRLLGQGLTLFRTDKSGSKITWVGGKGLLLGPDVHELKGRKSDWGENRDGEWEGEGLASEDKIKLKRRRRLEGEWEGDDFLGSLAWEGGAEEEVEVSGGVDEGEEREDAEVDMEKKGNENLAEVRVNGVNARGTVGRKSDTVV